MPDFGLTEALTKALETARGTSVMRPAEAELAARAAKAGPAGAAPAVPPTSATAPPAMAPVGSVQAPALDPSMPRLDIPAPTPEAAAASPAAQPADPTVAAGATDAAPPSASPGMSTAVPDDTAPPKGAPPPADPASPSVEAPPADGVPPANKLPLEPTPEPAAVDPIQAQAEKYVKANIGDFPPEKLNMTHMPNVETMTSPDGVKAAILQIADDNREAIEAARNGSRGVGAVSDQQLTGLARDLSLSTDVVKQVLGREFGTQLGRPEVVLAARMVEQNNMGTLLSLADKVANSTATSQELIQFEQHSQFVEQYRTQLSGAAAEQGRGLRAMRIPVGLEPSVADHIAEVIRKNNPNQVQTAQAIKLAQTPQGIASIVSGMSKMNALQRTGSAAFNLMQRIYINAILSGAPTWAKIFIGNNFNLALNTADLFSAGIGRGMVGLAARLGNFPTAADGATISDAIAHMHGVISGGADALRVAGRVMRTGQSMDGILSDSTSRASEGASSTRTLQAALPPDSYFQGIAKVIDNVIDAPGSRIIAPIDEFTKTLGYRGWATMQAMREVRSRINAGTLDPKDLSQVEQVTKELMENPDPAAQQASEDWAHRMTFQTPFPEGGVGEAFQTVLNRAPALRFIFPFMKTASNIFKQSIVERTPLAIFSARIRNQIAAGGFEGDLAKARIATGTAVGSMFAWMAIHDLITGDAPKDPKERAAWELDGRTPYSVRVTNPLTGQVTWRSYAWFEPVATQVGAVADIVKLQSYIHADDDVDTLMPHDDMANQAIAHVMASIVQNTGNKTFMQGAAQFSEMYNDPQRAFSMWADSMGAAMQPYSGATKFIRNMQDPYMRQAFTLIDKIRDQVPTWHGVVDGSKTLPRRLDVFGEPRTHSGDNSILGPLNPLPGSSSKPDPVTDEVQALMEQTRTVPITMPSKQLALLGNGRGLQDGQGMRLNPDEYEDYVLKSRADPVFNNGTTTFHDKLAQTIASPVYQAATPAVRATLIENVQNQADRIGRQNLFRDNPDFAERMTAWTAEKNRLKFNQ